MTAVVYDAGALIAAERNDRGFWADHRVRLESGVTHLIPTPVIAQVSRSPRQVQLRRLLRGCDAVPLEEQTAHEAGALLGRVQTRDIIDAVVVQTAGIRRATIVSSDRTDLERLLDASTFRVQISDV